jgi:Protein of unknown function (DUF2924)
MEAKQEKGASVAAFPAELPALESFSLDELRREWRRLYHNEPPRISRDLLMRGIGYRLQELQHGGLGKATHRKLRCWPKCSESLAGSHLIPASA